MIIDRDVQVLPPNAVVEIHIARAAGDPVAHPGDPTEFLGVEVQQIPGVRVLVPLHQGGGPRRPRRDRPQRRSTRAAVAALTPTAPPICAHVQRWWRSTLIPS
jgi:hypothetical protein